MKKIILAILLVCSFNAHAKSPASVLVYNVTDNALIDSSNEHCQVSIASISKLMAVYTVLISHQKLDEVLTVNSRVEGRSKISRNMKITRLDLIKLSLVHSDNLAALTLSEHFPGGKAAFVTAMNQNAKLLGMRNTTFLEPTGLDASNSSTVTDIATLTNAASKYEIFRSAAKTQHLTVMALKGKRKIKIQANPTIKFFGHNGVMTIKTGFTNAAGWCITMLVFTDNKLYNLVILGATSKKERITIIEKSLQTIRNI